MQGVQFGDKHSYSDWGLILTEAPTVSPPKVKTNYVDILGADGSLDLTEQLTGTVLYEMRDITCKFALMSSRDTWAEMYSTILNHLHGKAVNITLDKDPDYFYSGRAEVNKWNEGNTAVEVIIKAKVAPYKISRTESGRKVL